MIRLATLHDVPAVCNIIMDSHRDGGFCSIPNVVRPDAESILEMLVGLVDSPRAGFFVADSNVSITGAACVLLTAMPWNKHVLTAAEVFWDLASGARETLAGRRAFIGLHRYMVSWAQARGSGWMQCMTRTGAVGKFLERRGFSFVETNFGRAF